MSNFKNALKIQGLIEENVELNFKVKQLESFSKIDKNRINSLKKECTDLKEMIENLHLRLEATALEKVAMQEELNILKAYFKLKLLL